MPLYEYECRQCRRRFEKIQKFSDPPETACPECGGGVERLISSPAFHFKGTGWYVTDYASKPSGQGNGKSEKAEQGEKADKGDKGDKGDGGDKGERKGESKPAAETKSSQKPAETKS